MTEAIYCMSGGFPSEIEGVLEIIEIQLEFKLVLPEIHNFHLEIR